MSWIKVFIYVSCGALAGMAMGVLFGYGAGTLAPNSFAQLKLWRALPNIEPRGSAIVLGGIAGVLLGGGLSAFAIIVQIFLAPIAAHFKSNAT